jgi:hypothetical protein
MDIIAPDTPMQIGFMNASTDGYAANFSTIS